MSSRNPHDLHPELLPLYVKFRDQAKAEGIDFLLICTYRSNLEQDALYAQGRTRPGKKVTNARGGQSAHNYTINNKPASKAFDVVLIRNGKCVWGTKDHDLFLWQRLGIIGTELGLKWYGSPGSKFVEFPHFELK